MYERTTVSGRLRDVTLAVQCTGNARSSFAQIHKELGIFSQAVADWRNYASDVLIDYIVVNKEKLGGVGEVKRLKLTRVKLGKENIIRVISWRDSGFLAE
ncbi:hypothetical protein TNCV_5107151 [Trichonephila clavipes]|uniref:Uncharacterized protein n=1 Tax=Trichonephila clavipes TaxID=2585209 RepID=A0A8X6RAJ0_TRICX|nr:hypothetical protein TNCV_5107151 [Trichonephila clavipes]